MNAPSRFNPLATLLFWLMALSGGACLAAALVLPAWLEQRVAQAAYADAQRRIAELEKRLTTLEKQIEHIEKDPAYNERLARREFGIQPAGVETVRLDVALPEPADPPAPPVAGDPIERLGALVDKAARENALVAAFVLDETRPYVLAMGGGVLLAALLLLNRGLWIRRRTAAGHGQWPPEDRDVETSKEA